MEWLLTILWNERSRSRGLSAHDRLESLLTIAWITHLCVGSKVLWLKNDYKKAPKKDARGRMVVDPVTGEPTYIGFMNGALGMVERPNPSGAWVKFDDGAEDAICATELENLTLGWAISVHKAQGSSFKRVIVPIIPSRILDRTLIYTAVTRAVETVVLVGDPTVIRKAIEAPPEAASRLAALDLDHLLVDET